MTENLQKNEEQNTILQNIYQFKDCFIPEKILIFDLIGNMAHFRNLQTNSTSLSYYFPPPTTIYGIIAAILGLPRDSYYEQFSYQKIFLGLDILTPLRKELYTMNYLKYKESGYTQIPIEVIFPMNADEFRYRVYFAIQDIKIYGQLKTLLQNHQAHYPPSLGLSEMLANFEYIGEASVISIPINEQIKVNSVIRHDKYDIQSNFRDFKIFPEFMRYYFMKGRIPGPMLKYFYLVGGKLIIKIKAKDHFFWISWNSTQKYAICRL